MFFGVGERVISVWITNESDDRLPEGLQWKTRTKVILGMAGEKYVTKMATARYHYSTNTTLLHSVAAGLSLWRVENSSYWFAWE